MTNTIVEKPIKVDLHIHSAASSHKDGSKVSQNTAENLPVLIQRLEDQEVNLVSISDHDCFDYDLYRSFVSLASSSEVIEKVLPAVEFSVGYKVEGELRVVHIVTVFDDKDQDALKRLSEMLELVNGHPSYDCAECFSEKSYWEIIKKTGVDVVLIAHQKNSLGSKKPRVNDASSVGEELFNELVFLDYFEAYEYKNQKNELFNKTYNYSKEETEQIRFITGSDCHNWSCYPHVDSNDSSIPHPTYLKCLPTFRGLSLAVTDLGRIKTVPKFFNPAHNTLQELELVVSGTRVKVPLSKGINAIIGDNSIGKSLMLNALTGFRHVNASTKNGYNRYLAKIGVSIESKLEEGSYKFDGQGDIKDIFEGIRNGRTKASDILSRHFPEPVDNSTVLTAGKSQISLLCDSTRKAIEFSNAISSMPSFDIPTDQLDAPAESVSLTGSLRTPSPNKDQAVIDKAEEILASLDSMLLENRNALTPEDTEDIKEARKHLSGIVRRHKVVVGAIKLKKRIANAFSAAFSSTKTSVAKVITDRQQAVSSYNESIDAAATAIINAVEKKACVADFSFEFDPIPVVPKENPVGDLTFVSKLGIESLTPALLNSVLSSVLKVNKCLDFTRLTRSDLIEAIKNYPDDVGLDPVAVLKERMINELEKRLAPQNAIIKDQSDLYEELSQGFNAQMYFSLMADSALGESVYLIDQPEDQISQNAIKHSVLKEFRSIAQSRQVILVTHNPQFLVNLDVDNVIALSMEGGELCVRHGALEYECATYSVLQVVADTVEGGLDTIKKRMKRYDKNS